MTLELMRSTLYPLGFLASLLFGLRFIFQWIYSEKQKRSTVTPLFWKLSLTGNTTMVVHSLIQLQYPICLIQTLSGVIAWRNLNLMGTQPTSKRFCLIVMVLCASVISLYFISIGAWMPPPLLPWTQTATSPPPFLWHLVGFLGMGIFASRFWVQWWGAEKKKKSYLGKPFWWTSLAGATLSVLFFIRLNDPVNILGYSVGLLPYVRNLMLLNKKEA